MLSLSTLYVHLHAPFRQEKRGLLTFDVAGPYLSQSHGSYWLPILIIISFLHFFS